VKFLELAGDSWEVQKGIDPVTESPAKGRGTDTADMRRKRVILKRPM
jgi:hypothetical protein